MNDMMSELFTIMISDDDINEAPEEFFNIVLTSPSVGLSTGDNFVASVDIIDNDSK